MKNRLNFLIIFLFLIICFLSATIFFESSPSNKKLSKTLLPNLTDNSNKNEDQQYKTALLEKHKKSFNVYYIDNLKGNNNYAGKSEDSPWKDFSNIKKTSFAEGDNILLKKGCVWNQTLYPPAGGNKEKPIVIDSYGKGDLPVIDVEHKYSTAIRIYHSYLSINNIKAQNSTSTCIAISAKGGVKELKLKNIEIYNAGNNGIGITQGGSEIEIRACYIENARNNGIMLGGSAKNKLTNVLVSDCHIVKALGNDGITIHEDGNGNSAGSNFLLKNNISEMCGEQGFDITTGENVLLLDNVSNMNRQGGVIVGHSAHKVTIKGHTSSDEPTENTSAAMNFWGKSGNIRLLNSIIKGFGYHLLSINTDNVAVYNNNFIWEGGSSPIDISGKIENIYFINNIVYSKQNRKVRIRFLEPSRPINYPGFHFDHNIYHIPDNNLIFHSNNKNFNLKKIQTIFKVESHSMNSDPKFVHSPHNGYHLEKNSPAIDQGGFYAYVLNRPDKNELKLNNSLFFYKGFAEDYLQCIKFKETDTTYKILDVNYIENIISLNKDVRIKPNIQIGNCYNNSAIDIGAYEFKTLTPPSN